jgi:hypothetical protein
MPVLRRRGGPDVPHGRAAQGHRAGCELVAVSRTGERRVVIGWLVPVAGTGFPAIPVT